MNSPTGNTTTSFRYSLEGAQQFFWAMVVAAIVCVVVPAGLAFADPEAGSPLVFIFPALVGLGLLAFGWSKLQRAKADREPKLIIGPEGIHALTVAAAPIPWAAISRLTLVRPRHKRPATLSIAVDDRAKYQPTTQSRLLGSSNALLSGGDFVVQISELEGDHAAIADAIRAANPSCDLRIS